MLNCQGCGLTNRPYDTVCAICERSIQDEAAAQAKRREWDALPPAIREDQEKVFDRMREGVLEHLRWFRNHRATHALLGAVLVSVFMNAGVFFALLWPIPIDLLVGATAGLILNRLKGGSWNGAGIFVAAAVVSVLLKIPFMDTEAYLRGVWFFTCFAVFMMAIAGYLMGLKLDFEHTDHNVIG